MIPNQILGIPIIEQAPAGDFVAAEEIEFYSQLRCAIDRLRCPACGSLNYTTTLFVLSASNEAITECRDCGNVGTEAVPGSVEGVLAFLSHYLLA